MSLSENFTRSSAKAIAVHVQQKPS